MAHFQGQDAVIENPNGVRIAPIIGFALMVLQRLVNLALTLVALGSIVLFAMQYIAVPALQHSWPILLLQRYLNPVFSEIAKVTHLPGLRAYIPLLAVVLCFFISGLSDRLFSMLRAPLNLLAAQEARRAKEAAAKKAAEVASVDSEAARAKLYKEYQNIEKKLKEANKRQCTFLSVDVVGSTGMKDGETEIAITSTFRAYEDLLRRTFKQTKSWKESWTPDGVMICFQNRENAVEAAQTILTKLLAFNEHGNALKTRFDVRCGINEGEVVIFEDSDVEKLVEHTIDVAGHMQKYAKPGSLLLSKEVYELLKNPAGFVPGDKEVDGYQTYQWTPPA